MCGFTTIFAYGENAPLIDKKELTAIHQNLAPRGPDGEGVWIAKNQRLAMAHRRLSIIDITESGAQPMVNADESLRIVYNGEVYNYRELRRQLLESGVKFFSNSDTEVLLHLYARYGSEMVQKLRGMFAFVIWDQKRQGLFIARDAFGIKPLYFADDGKTIRISSQVKSLLAGKKISNKPEPAGHVGFFLLGSVPDPYTLYKEIKALPSGSSIWVDQIGPNTTEKWFNLRKELVEIEPKPFSQEKVTDALVDTVRHHLIADVPVGLFLSSGLDSATLTALASEEQGENLRTVTLGFDSFRGTKNDEVCLAEIMARQCKTKHQTKWLETSEFKENIENLLKAMDQPSIDGTNVFFVSKIAREAGLKVAISGVGGDEIFGGYNSFQQVPGIAKLLSIFQFMPMVGRTIRILSAPIVRQLVSPKYASIFEYGSSLEDAYFLRRGLFMPWELPEILEPSLVRAGLEEISISKRLKESFFGARSNRIAITALETSWYLNHQLLRDSDWAGMANSLEIRTPLVDVTFLRKLAPMLASGHPPTKRHLAQSPSLQLPAEIINRRKTGFNVPIPQWIIQKENAGKKVNMRQWAQFVYSQQWSGD